MRASTSAPGMRVVLFQLRSASLRVLVTTYFEIAFI